MRVQGTRHHSARPALRHHCSVLLTLLLAGCRAAQARSLPAAPREPMPVDTVRERPALTGAGTGLPSLDLNIPAYRLDVVLQGRTVRSYRIAVGMPAFPTHRGRFSIARIQWNPWWVPPKSDWAKNERPAPPGPTNPMGKVKLQFHELLFIHGTPDEASLGKPSSHGCVRLANVDAIEIALAIERSMLNAAAVDSVAAVTLSSWRTMDVKLPAPIDVLVRYELVEVRGDTLRVYGDPYGLGGSPAADALAVLAREGLDSTAVEFGRIRRLRGYPAKTALSLPIRADLR